MIELLVKNYFSSFSIIFCKEKLCTDSKLVNNYFELLVKM